MKVYLSPFPEDVNAENGVGQVVLAQHRLLPGHGVDLVRDQDEADICASHIVADGIDNLDVLHLHGLYWTGDKEMKTEPHHHGFNHRIVQAMRRARLLTFPSDWAAMAVKRDMRLSPTIIPNGIDTSLWTPQEHQGYVLWNKNRVDDVCDPTPAYELAKRGIKVVSTFMYPAPYVPDMRVIGRKPHAEMKSIIEQAFIYLATTQEVMSVGVLEALASGVPILGYAWGGTKDVVQHGMTGWLAEPGDIDGLIEGYAWISQNRHWLQRECADRAKDYDWSSIIQQYAVAYNNVLIKKQRETHEVAVVITSYNYGRYLADCIESVLQQDYVSEIIVVDDGSTDDTSEIAARYAPRVRLIRQGNKGVAVSRNRGIEESSQSYIICLDADDQLAPGYVATLRDALLRDRSLGVVYADMQGIDDAGNPTRAWEWGSFSWEGHLRGNKIPCAAMFRREMWERCGGYRPYGSCEDYEFWTRGLSLGFDARKVSDEPLFIYRMHEGSQSRIKPCLPLDRWLPWMWTRQYPLAAPAKQQQLIRSYHRPLVSVVIPVGSGHETLLFSAIESVIGQSFQDWEIVVVDDAGGNIDLDWMSRTYPFVQVVPAVSAGNGAGYARNIGLAHASAPLVLWLDADDWLMPNALWWMVQSYAKSDGKYIYTDWASYDGVTLRVHESPPYSQRAWGDHGLHAVTVLMATDDAKSVGGFDEAMAGWEDWEFFARCAMNGICGQRLAMPLLGYRTSTGKRREIAQEQREVLLEQIKMVRGEFVGCCGGNGAARMAAKRIGQAQGIIAGNSDLVRMQFIGSQIGAVTFFGKNGRQYRGGNNATSRYATVHADDVALLQRTGQWELVGKSIPSLDSGEVEVVPPPEIPYDR